MLLKCNHVFLFFLCFLYSCKNEEIKQEDKVFSQIGVFYSDEFDKRIAKLLSPYDDGYFAIIDYSNCAKCSEGKVVHFFDALKTEIQYNIIFTDSVVFNQYADLHENCDWFYVPKEYFKEQKVESTLILMYQKLKGGEIKRIE